MFLIFLAGENLTKDIFDVGIDGAVPIEHVHLSRLITATFPWVSSKHRNKPSLIYVPRIRFFLVLHFQSTLSIHCYEWFKKYVVAFLSVTLVVSFAHTV